MRVEEVSQQNPNLVVRENASDNGQYVCADVRRSIQQAKNTSAVVAGVPGESWNTKDSGVHKP